jgi:fructose-1,6-bisphosphatase/sedoheptulose 1,7-bisphosphatase-like protein
VTEAAALGGAEWFGKGDKNSADQVSAKARLKLKSFSNQIRHHSGMLNLSIGSCLKIF